MKLEFQYKQVLLFGLKVELLVQHDLTIAKNDLLQVYSNKNFIENKKYVGHERILTPFKTPTNQSEELWNSLIGKLRVSVEHIYERIKIFQCLNVL